MAELVSTPEGLVLRTSTLQSFTLDFDGFALAEGGEQPIPDGFGGFDWLQAGVYNPDGAIPGYVAASGQNLAFIAEAGGGEIAGYEDAAAGSPLVLTRDAPFSLGSAAFTAAFSETLEITVRAFADAEGTEIIGQKTFTVARGVLETVDFTAGLDFGTFAGASRIEFSGDDGDGSTLDYFGFDDLAFTTGAVTDRPVTVIDFDALPLAPGGEARVADGFGGFSWSSVGAYDVTGGLPGYTAASGSTIGFIAEAAGVEIAGYEDTAAGAPATLTRAEAFEFLGGAFSAAFRSSIDITIRGYADEAGTELVAEATITAEQGVAGEVTFLDGTFAGLRRIEFSGDDGDASTADYFGFDDLLFA